MNKQQSSNRQKLEINQALRTRCPSTIGFLDSDFLCQSIGLLPLREPKTVQPETPLHEALMLIQENNIGCVTVVDSQGVLCGIFSERDYMVKIYNSDLDTKTLPIGEVMTSQPICAVPEDPIAFVLNLMSQGGFRHVPVVDQDKMPIATLSVRHIVDYMVERLTADLLNIEVPS